MRSILRGHFLWEIDIDLRQYANLLAYNTALARLPARFRRCGMGDAIKKRQSRSSAFLSATTGRV